MNYWILTTEYPPEHGGGISTYCDFTARMFAEAGHHITIFTRDDGVGNLLIKTEHENITVVRINSNRDKLQSFLGYSARLSYAYASAVRYLIEKEGKPDFIECQDYMGIGYYLTQIKNLGYTFLSGIPIILTLHSPVFIYLLYNRVPVYRFPDFWTGEMEKQSIAAADALIAPSHFIVEEIEKHMSVPGKHLQIISNPFKSKYEKHVSFKRNKIIYYGKLSAQKGSFELLGYFKKLWDEGFEHALHIIGGTDIVYYPEMKTMGQLVQEKYGTYISKKLLQLHGKIQPQDLEKSLSEAHVMIVPSIVDNLPYVVMEAMSLGKIVLASVQGGQKEMLEDGVSGFLFDHKDPQSFSAQLKRILALSDEAVQQIGSKACQEVTYKYAFENIRIEKMELLQRIKSKEGNKIAFPFLYQEQIMPVVQKEYLKGLLSIVIPFYNLGNYIQECLESVLNSSYKNIEVIIINDGSTEVSSIVKLKELEAKNVLRIVTIPNGGLADARNLGASLANGEFLAFLDADDKVADLYYERTINSLQQNENVYFAGSWVQYFENSNNVWPTFTPQAPYALVHNPVNSSGLVYKRNAFLAGGLNDKRVDYGMEDYESVIHMMSKGYNGVVLPEVLFYYRVRSGSMFRNVSYEKLVYSNKYIAEKHNKYYAKFATPIINLLNANGPGYMYDNPTLETTVSVKKNNDSLLLLKFKNLIKKNEMLKKIALKLLNIKSKL